MSSKTNTDRDTAGSSTDRSLTNSMKRPSIIFGAISLVGLATLSSLSFSQVNVQKTTAQMTANNSAVERNTPKLTAEDKLEIIELTARHDLAIDTWNPDAYADTYTDDGMLVNPGGTFRGKDTIRQALVDYEAKAKGNRHHSLSHVITLNDDGTVTLVNNFLTIKATNTQRQEVPYVLSHSVQTSRVRKVNGVWKFARREQTNAFTQAEPW